ncbi:sugar kinase [Clostridium sp. D2Q-11]|uniref:Sugar kinase n=1 Tax=Anaeromonas frigoriresistens TaxID=2683708 RepID=A0A942Z6R4_9FIRM|nr:sugar kinase [Anaeromonas frigoriresistens]MBS4537862.1 sugar kinase [Anaeromonas frigoriresistens]
MGKVITIGEILVEIMAKEIGQTFLHAGDYRGPFPSGAPAIFIDQVAKSGSPAKIISAVGKDGFGEVNLNRLESNGVDVSNIKVLEDETTGVAFVTYKEDGDRDFIYHISNAACGRINKNYISKEDFEDCSYFHIMGSAIYNEGIRETINKGRRLAKKYGCKISFDPNIRKEIVNDKEKKELLLNILYEANIVLAGEDELYYLTENKDEKSNVENLFNKNAEIVIIKRGSKGVTLYTHNKTVDISPYKVEEVDPTGAGDCFGGTFISCINQEIEVEKATRLATIAGAKAVTKKGPMEGNTTLEELEEVYKELY